MCYTIFMFKTFLGVCCHFTTLLGTSNRTALCHSLLWIYGHCGAKKFRPTSLCAQSYNFCINRGEFPLRSILFYILVSALAPFSCELLDLLLFLCKLCVVFSLSEQIRFSLNNRNSLFYILQQLEHEY